MQRGLSNPPRLVITLAACTFDSGFHLCNCRLIIAQRASAVFRRSRSLLEAGHTSSIL